MNAFYSHASVKWYLKIDKHREKEILINALEIFILTHKIFKKVLVHQRSFIKPIFTNENYRAN